MRSFLEASETNSIGSLPEASGYVTSPGFLTMDSEPIEFKKVCPRFTVFEQRERHSLPCFQKGETAHLAALQSATESDFEPLTPR